MNARTMQDADRGTALEVLPPVLFNTFKHHAGALRARIGAAAERGDAGLVEAAACSAVLGTKLMDVYTGDLSPLDISQQVIAQLKAENRLERESYSTWLAGCEEYAVIPFADTSRWVLRQGNDPLRFVHLHPGRWSPCTVRARANVLKTAYLVLIHARIHGDDPMDRAVINHVRAAYLGLSPLGEDPGGELGLGAMIELLRQP